MKIIQPPFGISVDRLRVIEYHVDVRHAPYGSVCEKGHVFEPDVVTDDRGVQSVVKSPKAGEACPECGSPLKRGPERFVAFLYRGGIDLGPHEALGDCVDVFPAREDKAEVAADADAMVRRHASKRGRRHF